MWKEALLSLTERPMSYFAISLLRSVVENFKSHERCGSVDFIGKIEFSC